MQSVSYTHLDVYKRQVTDEELKLFIAEQRTLPPDERRLINEVFDFGDTLAYEVMTPRTDMVCIEDNATIKDALELSLQSHFSRLPVYQGDLDNIIGFVHIKDILPHLSKGDMNKPVREIMRPIHFVPLTKRAMELLKELQQKRINLSLIHILAGPVTLKMKPVLERVWAQMPEPKWVLAMGNCATSGGPFKDGYSTVSYTHLDVYKRQVSE